MNLLCPQCTPLYATWHLHMYEFTESLHEPPLRQGELRHSSISSIQIMVYCRNLLKQNFYNLSKNWIKILLHSNMLYKVYMLVNMASETMHTLK